MDNWLLVLGGLVLLIAGGEALVRGAVRVAAGLGISPLVIGLTLVGFGTSTPELVTSVQAALNGSPGIAYGNVVGSNIANTLLIVGCAGLIAPILVASSTLKRDGVVMIAATLLFCTVAILVPMGPWIGVPFLGLLVAYITLAIRQERKAAAGEHGALFDKSAAAQATDPALVPDQPAKAGGLGVQFMIALGGLALVVIGGALLVGGATGLARAFGISEAVIGLTIVAIGTSLPELVTSVVAAWRREGEIAFGNVIGSNIYNILGIAGCTSLMTTSPVPPEIVRFDMPLMLAVSLLLIVLAWTGRQISRPEGGFLLAGYGLYLWVLWP